VIAPTSRLQSACFEILALCYSESDVRVCVKRSETQNRDPSRAGPHRHGGTTLVGSGTWRGVVELAYAAGVVNDSPVRRRVRGRA